MRVLRNRRRDADAGEADRLRREVDRTAALAGNGTGDIRVRVAGPGAGELIAQLQRSGRTASPAWDGPRDGIPLEAAELAWLKASLG